MQRLSVIGGLVLLAIAIVAALRIREGPRGEDGSGADAEAAIRIASTGSRASSEHLRKSSLREGSSVRLGPVYAGPRSLAEWTPPREWAACGAARGEGWTFREGALSSSGGGAIAREIPLPATCRIAFRVRWEEQFRFRLLLFCGESEIQPDNCYDLVIQRQFAYLRKRWMTNEGGGSRIMGQAAVHALHDAQEALIELLISREGGTIAMFVNGKREALWVDPEHETGEFGDWIQFAAEEGFPLEIAEITADGWDAGYPDTGDPQSSFFEPDSARIAALTPQGEWEPVEELRSAREQIREELMAALETAVGPERRAAEHEAIRANVVARQRYENALTRLPEATPDEAEPGFVFNPFTGERLDVRGVPAGSRIWDPRSGREDQVFRIP